jgi:hypothetical protein
MLIGHCHGHPPMAQEFCGAVRAMKQQSYNVAANVGSDD